MSLISLNNVTRAYGTQVVLEGASFAVHKGNKVGLVGRNGSGKSTILRLITGAERPDSGTVSLQPRLRLGQLEQDPVIEGSLTVGQAVLQGRPELVQMEAELRRLEQALGDETADHDAILTQYGELQHEFDRLGGYEFHGKASAVLCGLGLPVDTHERAVAVLSGGQRTRLALAQLLLSDPDVLLLDEPTNHLDLEATEWLQSYLQRSGATLLLVSHDRYLLDAVCDHIVEVDRLRTWSYRGNYTAFLVQKAERLEREKELFERQQQEIQKLEAYIRRYKEGNRATQAKSRENRLDRLERLDRPRDGKSLRLHMEQAERSGRDVVRAAGLGKEFGEVRLFDGLNLVVERGDRLGLVGPNGAGKTTLIKMIMGLEQPTSGTLSTGTNVHIGYFSQNLRTLSGSRAIIEEIVATSELDIPAARSMLARFLFTDEEVFKGIDDLSGGERNRVALCKLLLSRPNCLVLDEPTNHLDIATREGLISALQEFDGTIVVASHDRYLLDKISNRILEVAEGKTHLYEGNYSEYRRARYGEPSPAPPAPQATTRLAPGAFRKPQPIGPAAVRPAAAKPAAAKPAAASPGEARTSGKATAPAAPAGTAAAGKKNGGVPRLERQIQDLEGRLATLTERMNDPDLYKSPDMMAVVEEYDRVRLRLDNLYEEWTSLAG